MRETELEPPRRSSRTSRNTLPPSKGVRKQKIQPPNLRDVEQTMFILLSHRNVWYLIDEFVGISSQSSAIGQAVRRRGCEVQQRPGTLDDRVIQVWARWTHEVPDGVAHWEMKFR